MPNFALTDTGAPENHPEGKLPPVQGRHARHAVLALRSRSKRKNARSLERLYASFDHPESALDPIQIVRRYAAVDDREIVAFVAAGLAFGRVASVMASVEAMCSAWARRPRRSCARSTRSAILPPSHPSSIAGRAVRISPA